MTVKMRNPSGISAPLGLYSHVATSDSGLVAVAGQLSVDRDGAVVGAGDFKGQLDRVLGNLDHALRDAGCSFASVLQFTTYVVDRKCIAEFYDARAELFPRYFPDRQYPPNTLLIVNGLVQREFLVEIQTLALRA